MHGIEGDERFVDLGEWSVLATGAPVLHGCPVSFDCKLVSRLSAGTHTIYIGEIVDLRLDATATPLLYADGNFVHAQGAEARRRGAQPPRTIRGINQKIVTKWH